MILTDALKNPLIISTGIVMILLGALFVTYLVDNSKNDTSTFIDTGMLTGNIVFGTGGVIVNKGCTATGGRDYFHNGSVMYSSDGYNYCVFSDSCVGTRVKKYSCTNTSVRFVYYNCTKGCINNACKP